MSCTGPYATYADPRTDARTRWQVAENFEKYGKNHRLNIALLIGGVSFKTRTESSSAAADVLICTPGRLLDISSAASF